MSDLISRQAVISAICNACGKIDCDKMDKCEKLQLPPANCSEFPNNSDTISRQAAIDALDEQIEQCDKSLSSFDISIKDEFAVKVERASLVAFRETLEYLPSAEPEHIRGRWILAKEQRRENIENGNYMYNCSNCGCGDLHSKAVKVSYCWNCGAVMQRGEHDG